MNEDSYMAYEAKYATAERLRVAVLPRNKAVLFGALHAADITLVTVEFDGSGDDG